MSAFVEQCYVVKSDDDIITEYCNYEDALEILPQAHEVLKLDPFPSEAIEGITNIWHKDQSTKDWFASIVKKLEKKIEESDKNKI